LAKDTKLFTLAGIFGLLALRATYFRMAGSGAHAPNLARGASPKKMTFVMAWSAKKAALRPRTAMGRFVVAYNFRQ
jgi:hypothetical protein